MPRAPHRASQSGAWILLDHLKASNSDYQRLALQAILTMTGTALCLPVLGHWACFLM